ncbi:MAG TPA: deaminase [Trueperaceae bacterium]|nr:deaminase [Trueperaceae bacterium]
MPGAALAVPAYAELSHVWRECVDLAWEAHVAGSLPIAAVVVDHEGQVVARGRNRLSLEVAEPPHVPGTPYIAGVPLAHAEVNALLDLGYRRPGGARPTLYTTMEPCPLCMGAARMAGVGRVVFATRDAWAGCAVMAEVVPYLKRSGPTVEGPVPALEPAFSAWCVSVLLRRHDEPNAFLATLEASLPNPFAAGRLLHESGELSALAELGATAEEAWATVVAALQEPPG